MKINRLKLFTRLLALLLLAIVHSVNVWKWDIKRTAVGEAVYLTRQSQIYQSIIHHTYLWYLVSWIAVALIVGAMYEGTVLLIRFCALYLVSTRTLDLESSGN